MRKKSEKKKKKYEKKVVFMYFNYTFILSSICSMLYAINLPYPNTLS